MQQGHPGIHEKENTSQGSLSVRLSLLHGQSWAALPSSGKVEQWPRDERTEPAINTNMAFLTGSHLGPNYLQHILVRNQTHNCSKNKQHTHRLYHASHFQLTVHRQSRRGKRKRLHVQSINIRSEQTRVLLKTQLSFNPPHLFQT